MYMSEGQRRDAVRGRRPFGLLARRFPAAFLGPDVESPRCGPRALLEIAVQATLRYS